MKKFYKVRTEDKQLWFGTFEDLRKANNKAYTASKCWKNKVLVVEVDETDKEIKP